MLYLCSNWRNQILFINILKQFRSFVSHFLTQHISDKKKKENMHWQFELILSWKKPCNDNYYENIIAIAISSEMHENLWRWNVEGNSQLRFESLCMNLHPSCQHRPPNTIYCRISIYKDILKMVLQSASLLSTLIPHKLYFLQNNMSHVHVYMCAQHITHNLHLAKNSPQICRPSQIWKMPHWNVFNLVLSYIEGGWYW